MLGKSKLSYRPRHAQAGPRCTCPSAPKNHSLAPLKGTSGQIQSLTRVFLSRARANCMLSSFDTISNGGESGSIPSISRTSGWLRYLMMSGPSAPRMHSLVSSPVRVQGLEMSYNYSPVEVCASAWNLCSSSRTSARTLTPYSCITPSVCSLLRDKSTNSQGTRRRESLVQKKMRDGPET